MDSVRPREQRVTLHVPTGQGGFLEVRKIPTGLADTVRQDEGGVIFVDSEDRLTRATAEGDVVYRKPLDADARRLLSQNGRIYAVTKAGIDAVDPGSGQETSEFAFAQADKPGFSPNVVPQPDGGFLVLDGKQAIWLDSGLQETQRHEFPFERELKNAQRLPNGGVVGQAPGDYYHIGHLQVRNAEGAVLFQSEQVRPSCVDVTSDGRVLAVEYGPQHESHLVTIHPDGSVTKRPTETMARSVVALPDGSAMVVAPEDYSTSTFVHYAADGTELQKYEFERGFKPRNFLADPGRNQAYVVTQGFNKETTVFRIRLDRQEKTEVCSSPANLVTPPPLPDGRLVVFGPQGATVYATDGTSRSLPTLQAVQAELGDAALQSNLLLGENPFREQASLGQWLPVAAKHLPIADRKAFLDTGARPGRPARGADQCMDFPKSVSTEAALQAMGLEDPMVYQRMLMRETLSVGEQSFPDDAGRVSVSPERLVVQLPGQEPEERKYHEVDAALPVKAGDEYYVALAENAGGSKRALAWCHPASRSYDRFDVTAPIVGLYAGDSDRVYAVGSNGAVLTIEPPLAEGQHVQSRVKLPTTLLQPQGDTDIRVGADTVTIGGLVLERRSS